MYTQKKKALQTRILSTVQSMYMQPHAQRNTRSPLVCQTALPAVILSSDWSVTFEDFEIVEGVHGMVKDDQLDPKILQQITQLERFTCRVCAQQQQRYSQRQQEQTSQSFKTLEDLRKHLQSQHQVDFWYYMSVCVEGLVDWFSLFSDICLSDRKVFIQEHHTYTRHQLQQHIQNGDKQTRVKHEKCQFCQIVFFDQVHKLLLLLLSLLLLV
jgi:hypothetical protein